MYVSSCTVPDQSEWSAAALLIRCCQLDHEGSTTTPQHSGPYRESEKQAGLADTGVSNEQQLRKENTSELSTEARES